MADKNTVYMSEKQKVKEITDKLEAGLKELFESEKYKSYLSTMSKFHNYSFNNTLLIAMQKPEATLVAGYQAWQKNFERHVNKGEKAIRILAPAPYKIKEERDKLDPVTGEMMFDENGMPQKEETEVTIPAFRAVSVFDVSQTDGKPIPELEVKQQTKITLILMDEQEREYTYPYPVVAVDIEEMGGDRTAVFKTSEPISDTDVAEIHNAFYGTDLEFEIEKELGITWVESINYEDGSVITPEMARKEQLLYASTDKYGIYQLKPNLELDSLRFEGTESLKRMGITKDNFDAIKPENYTLLYVGELSELQKETQGATLEAIFEKFNLDHPEDFRGHSLSVSDIVVLHQNGQNTAHFVDSFGYTEIPDFLREQTPEKEEMQDTSGHNVQKTEPEIDGDEIIDLGDETEQVLAEMKKTLESEQETELAFSIADRFISIQEVDGGYDYSIMGADYKEIDGGIYDNPDVTIREALHDILEDLKSQPDYNGAKGNIQREDELIPMDYDGLMEKAEEANRIIPESTPSSVVADFKAKTGELFHDISEMNPEEIEETVKCHVQAKIEEYDINATIVDVAVTGSRCRGLEHEG